MSAHLNKKFAEIVKDKRIALIGPAPYLEKVQLKDKIYSYDLIVRLNQDFPPNMRFFENVGSKTDILYIVSKRLNSRDWAFEKQVEHHNIKSIVISFPHPQRCWYIKQHLAYRCLFRDIMPDDYDIYKEYLNAKPATGNMAILDLLSYDIKELFIAGITFYRDGLYHEGYATEKQQEKVRRSQKGGHKPEKQLEFMLKVFKEDARVNVEENMKSIIGM